MPLRRLLCLVAALASLGACNLVFGVQEGVPGGAGGATSGTGGREASSSSATSTASSGSTSTSGVTSSSGSTSTSTSASTTGSSSSGATSYPRIAVGSLRGCAIEDDESVRCWGDNSGSELLKSDVHVMLPTAQAIPGAVSAVQVSVGVDQILLLQADGTVLGWGGSSNGELGVVTDNTIAPTPIPGLTGVAVEVGAADSCSCARMSDGTVRCWGATDAGCLGNASMTQGQQPTPTAVPGVMGAVELRVGGYGVPTCARLTGGTVSCWNPHIAPSTVPGVTDATDVAVGNGFVFIQSKTLGVMWSQSNKMGGWTTATAYTGAGTLTAMAAGKTFVGLRADGTIVTGSLDNGHPSTPMPITGQPSGTVVEIAAGYGYSYDGDLQCLRLSGPIAANVYCWGDDGGGALGTGAKEDYTQAVAVSGVTGTTWLSTAESSSSVVLASGAVAFWGWSPALDANDSYLDTATPTMAGYLGAANVAIRTSDADDIAYALQKSGAPTLVDQATPTTGRLSSYTNLVDVYEMQAFDIGLLATGSVVVYGANSDTNSIGIFGDGTTTGTMNETAAVPGITTATALSAYCDDYNPGPGHACVLVGPNDTVSCWGSNHSGEVGVASPMTVDTPTAVAVAGNPSFVSIAAARDFTCGATSAGGVYCWGQNGNGQLGTGFMSPPTSSTPLAVQGITNAVGVSARESFACAWLADKTAKCWGGNRDGELGDGTFDDSASPVTVKNLSDVVEIAAGAYHACARHSDGSVSCWGSSYYGQVGTGVTGEFMSPGMVLGL